MGVWGGGESQSNLDSLHHTGCKAEEIPNMFSMRLELHQQLDMACISCVVAAATKHSDALSCLAVDYKCHSVIKLSLRQEEHNDALSCLAAEITSAVQLSSFPHDKKRPAHSRDHDTKASPSWTCDLDSLILFLSAW